MSREDRKINLNFRALQKNWYLPLPAACARQIKEWQ